MAITNIMYNIKSSSSFFSALLIGIIYSRFLLINVLHEESFLMDLVLYITLLSALVTKAQYKVNELLLLCIIVGVSLINPVARNIFLILSIVFLLSKFKIKEIAIMNLIFIGITLFIMIILHSLDIIQTNIMHMNLLNDNRIRYDFGMGNPNKCATFVFGALANLYYLFEKKNPILIFIILIVAYIYIGEYTGSRTFQIACIVLMTFPLFRFNNLGDFILGHNYIIWGGLLGVIVCLLCVVYATFDYKLLDIIFTGRISLAKDLVANSSPINYLMGNSYVKTSIIDNSYFHLIFEAGIFIFILFIISLVKTIQNIKLNTLYLIPLLAAYVVYGLMESIMTDILSPGNMILWCILWNGYYNWIKN